MKWWLISAASIIVPVTYITWALLRPLPDIQPVIVYKPKAASSSKPEISLSPDSSQSIAIGNNGFVLSSNENEIRPIASTAKIMLALLVLEKHPLKIGEQGPIIPITNEDVSLYQQMLASGHSTVPVQAGTNLSEYQALQALLIASANNTAYKLAVWGFGSEAEYIKIANDYAKKLGMTSTTFADASGFSPNTTSTSKDMLILSQKAILNPILAGIVSQKTAELPAAGIVQNTNYNLGVNGIDGIKTGLTDEAGGCLLYSVKTPVNIVGAMIGAPSKEVVFAESKHNIEQILNNITKTVTVYKGQPIGYYQIPWSKKINMVAKDTLFINTWKNEVPATSIETNALTKNNAFSGRVKSTSSLQENAEINLQLTENLTRPSLLWRLTHPF